MSALRGCTVIVLSGPGSRARQLDIPRGWPLWMCLISLISVTGSLFAGRQARAFFDPSAQRPGVMLPAAEPLPVVEEVAPPVKVLKPRRRNRAPVIEQPLPSSLAAREAAQALEPRPEPARLRNPGPAGELQLFDVNASHSINVQPFDPQGMPDAEAFDKLKEFMRCRRTGQAHDMDPNLVALLVSISAHFEGAMLHVISGHRAADDLTTRPSSQHTRGTAADIRIPGVGIETLAKAAHELGARGVGVYPLSRFVHVDVRPQPYYWRDVGTGPVATRAPF